MGFLKQAREPVRLYHPLTIITDKARTYATVIGEINASLKQRLRPMRGSQTLVGAKAALPDIETFRTIRRNGLETASSALPTRSTSRLASFQKPRERHQNRLSPCRTKLMQRTPCGAVLKPRRIHGQLPDRLALKLVQVILVSANFGDG